MRSPVRDVECTVTPVPGHFCGRVLRESTGRGSVAIVIWKFWVALSPVGDRRTGTRGWTTMGVPIYLALDVRQASACIMIL